MSTVTNYSVLISEFASIFDAFNLEPDTFIDFDKDTVAFAFDEFCLSMPIDPLDLRYGDGCYDLVTVPGKIVGMMDIIDKSVTINYEVLDVDLQEEEPNLLIYVAIASRLAYLLSEDDELPDAVLYIKENMMGLYFSDYNIEFTYRGPEIEGREEFERPAQFVFCDDRPVLRIV